MFDNPTDRTPSVIAAGVRRSGTLQSLELEAKTLRETHAGLLRHIRQVCGDRHRGADSDDAPLARQIRELSQQREDLEQRMQPVLQRLRSLRNRHAADVSAALDPTRSTAAQDAQAAIVDLMSALRILIEADDEVVRAGGDRTRLGSQASVGFNSVAHLAATIHEFLPGPVL